jgi:hypothetical protein
VQTEPFEEYRSLLFAMAYRMMGSAMDADASQPTINSRSDVEYTFVTGVFVNEGDLIMDTAITVIQVVLTLIFTSGGLLKLTLPYAKFTKLPFQPWANDFQPEHIKLIGVIEACAAVGMIVPLFLPSLTMPMPLVAVGMALVMSGAMATHLRRSEYLNMVGNLTWLGLALFVAYSRLVGFAV